MKFLIVTLFLFSLTVAHLERFFFKENQSFALSRVIPNWGRCQTFSTPVNQEIKRVLSQPFTYWTKGKQSYVFLSEDQQWVIKFPRLGRFAKRFGSYNRFSNSTNQVFENFYMASMELQEETSVVYAHLSPDNHLNQKIELIDHLKAHYFLEANDIPFALQRRGQSFFTVFAQADNKKELIDAVISLFDRLYAKGFIDRDPLMETNFGMTFDQKPFIIDFGEMEKCNSLPARKEYLEAMTQTMSAKLQQESAELYSYYKNLLH